MRITLSKFGPMLVSRPAGRDALLAASAYLTPVSDTEPIELDFTDVHVLAPSWADEFITGLRAKYGERLVLLPSDNPSVKLTLATISQSSLHKRMGT